jgi:DNA-binding PadR family transcriptional regulator
MSIVEVVTIARSRPTSCKVPWTLLILQSILREPRYTAGVSPNASNCSPATFSPWAKGFALSALHRLEHQGWIDARVEGTPTWRRDPRSSIT